MASSKGGLGKWFGEEWVDVKTGKPCGRKKAKANSKRPYPACRPKKVASKISKAEAKKKRIEKIGIDFYRFEKSVSRFKNRSRKQPIIVDFGILSPWDRFRNKVRKFRYKKEEKVYTGNEIIGIAQMHKSNAVPIRNKKSAEDVAKMRRG